MLKHTTQTKLLSGYALILSTLLLNGCTLTPPKEEVEPDPNHIFHNMYTTVTLAANANGNQTKFRWKNNSQPFPYQEASWADVTVFPCDQGTKGKLELTATTYDQNLGTEKFPTQVKKVKETWENHGLTVHYVGTSKSNEEIATKLPDKTVVVYTAGLGGESIEAETQCITGFTADKTTAVTYPATPLPTTTPTP